MMKAEMAREMTRSRNQIASTGVFRWMGFAGGELLRDVLNDSGGDILFGLYYGRVRVTEGK